MSDNKEQITPQKWETPLPERDLNRFFVKHKCTHEEQVQLRALLVALRLGQIHVGTLQRLIEKYEHILYE